MQIQSSQLPSKCAHAWSAEQLGPAGVYLDKYACSWCFPALDASCPFHLPLPVTVPVCVAAPAQAAAPAPAPVPAPIPAPVIFLPSVWISVW